MADDMSLARLRIPAANYNTQLPQMDEFQFRNWVAQNRVPFDPNATAPQDYDMRGYYQGLMQQNPQARPTEVNPNDMRPHYTDNWKTPLHQTFSAGSQWAGRGAPNWNEKDQLVSPGGRIVADERRQPSLADLLGMVRR
jgi:hypothetical protein